MAAGFVRNAVWDHMHGRTPSALSTDVDVIWYDRERTDPSEDADLEAVLRCNDPSVRWSVKNQARMHVRNGDGPYASATDAMRFWPETATAVAVRRSAQDCCEVAAPYGLDDLLGLVVRPTPPFADHKRQVYQDRLKAKDWIAIWPGLRFEGA